MRSVHLQRLHKKGHILVLKERCINTFPPEHPSSIGGTLPLVGDKQGLVFGTSSHKKHVHEWDINSSVYILLTTPAHPNPHKSTQGEKNIGGQRKGHPMWVSAASVHLVLYTLFRFSYRLQHAPCCIQELIHVMWTPLTLHTVGF